MIISTGNWQPTEHRNSSRGLEAVDGKEFHQTLTVWSRSGDKDGDLLTQRAGESCERPSLRVLERKIQSFRGVVEDNGRKSDAGARDASVG